MTPLAHRIVKELTLPKKERTFNDQAGLLSRMDDIHCFECTEVFDFIADLAESSGAKSVPRQHIGLNLDTLFLPAPRTWLEWRYADGLREGVLLVEHVIDGVRCAECVWAAHGINVWASNKKNGWLAMGSDLETLISQERWVVPRDLEGESVEKKLGWLRWLWAALALINTPRIIGRRQHMPHRGLERALTKAMRPVGKFPLNAWTEIKLEVMAPKDMAGDPSIEAHLTGKRALHWCRAHLRLAYGKVIIVSSHWRGDGALGVRQSRHVLKPPRAA